VKQEDERGSVPPGTQQLFQRVKSATVAMVILHENHPKRPFTILGSGFCIHPRGVIVTCRHVAEAFLERKLDSYFAELPAEQRTKEIQELRELCSFRPYALFSLVIPERHEVVMFPAPVEFTMAKMDLDLGMFRLSAHTAFLGGYPVVEIEEFNRVYEGMEVATCGFPLGCVLKERMGTVTSSFTRGTLSAIIPAAGAPQDQVKAFQLDLRATHGNSGGPVFSVNTGRVIGVLQGGITDDYGSPLFSRAEPVYRVIAANEVERILAYRLDDFQKKF